MRKRKAKLLTSLAAVTAAVLAVSGGLGAADGPSSGGEVHLYEADTALAGNLGTAVLTGAITRNRLPGLRRAGRAQRA